MEFTDEELMDKIDNISLIENGLIHTQFEMSCEKVSFFRIAREAHLFLYRSTIESLRGTANIAITVHPSKKRSYKYKLGNDPYKEIHKIKIDECEKAWRFSEPKACEEANEQPKNKTNSNFLISFYDTLAMVQTECFMKRYIHSKAIYIENEKMKLLEWLHEKIRNEYEHFIPKLYIAPIYDLLYVSNLCMDISKKLIFKSGNIIIYENGKRKKIGELFHKNMDKIEQKLREKNC